MNIFGIGGCLLSLIFLPMEITVFYAIASPGHKDSA
jgi:hypothetical protein